MNERKRALVTGAGGFIGANLARRLLQDGHEVHLFAHSSRGDWRLAGIAAKTHRHEVDLERRDRVASLVNEIKPDWVFHLAAHGAYSWQTDLDRIIQTNFLGAVNLTQACLEAGCEAFINAGSSSEYGLKDHAPAETEWLEPNSYYAATKAAATLFCRYTAQRSGRRLTTLRLYSAYGPYEDPGRLMPTLIRRGLRGLLPPLVNPEVARDYVYIDDVCEAFMLAATQPNLPPGAVYNIGTGAQTALREVVAVAREIMGVAAEPRWGSMPNRQWDTSVWVSDSRLARAELGWRPRRDFVTGLRTMVEWFRAHPDEWGPPPENCG